jgi:hypothetical protein
MRKADVDGFNVFYREAGRADAPVFWRRSHRRVRRIKHALFSHPAPARLRHIRALLLRRAQAFF